MTARFNGISAQIFEAELIERAAEVSASRLRLTQAMVFANEIGGLSIRSIAEAVGLSHPTVLKRIAETPNARALVEAFESERADDATNRLIAALFTADER